MAESFSSSSPSPAGSSHGSPSSLVGDHLPPFKDRFQDIPEPIRSQIFEASLQIMQQYVQDKEEELEAKQEEYHNALMLEAEVRAAVRPQTEMDRWWAQVKREREAEEAREFKRCLYEVKVYMRELEGSSNPHRPYRWEDSSLVDNGDEEEEDGEILEIYD